MRAGRSGTLVVGIHGDAIEGTDSKPKRVNELRQAAIDFSVPPVRAVAESIPCTRSDGAADHLLAFHVEPSEQVHSNRKDEVFLRIGDENRRLTFPQRQELLYDKGQVESDPLRTTRFARNPRIARVCAELRFGQELGEGIPRMFEAMRDAGLTDPIYRQTSGSVHLILSAEPMDRRLDELLYPEARLVLETLREVGRLSTGEVVDLTRLSRPAAIARLKALQDAGLIQWVGKSPKDPRAYWTMVPR